MARTSVTLPEAMIREIDEMTGPRGRSAYVAEAVETRLKRDRMRRVFDETYGAAVGHSQWQDADEVYRWVRSLREDSTRDERVWGKGGR
jgi:metal-responsive CopG/Arc/MetJ family transcriptional regulator